MGFPQYVNPQGTFFGGSEVEEVVEKLGRYLEKALSLKSLRYVSVVDVHTGLGDEFGGSQCMVLRDPSTSELVTNLRQAHPIFRNLRTLDPDLFKNSVLEYIPALLRKTGSAAKFLGIHQDFGTYSQLSLIEALSMENRHYHHSKPGLSAEEKQIKIAKTNEWRTYCAGLYAPEDPGWWIKVIKGGRELVETLLAIMAEDVAGQAVKV